MKEQKNVPITADEKRKLIIAYVKLAKLSSKQERQLLNYLCRLAARHQR